MHNRASKSRPIRSKGTPIVPAPPKQTKMADPAARAAMQKEMGEIEKALLAADPGLSKNALKKKVKAEFNKRVKARKNANKKPQQNKKKKKVVEEEEELDPTKYRENRLAQIKAIEASGRRAYPHKFDVQMKLPVFVEKFSSLADGAKADETTSVAGRVHRSVPGVRWACVGRGRVGCEACCAGGGPRARKQAKRERERREG